MYGLYTSELAHYLCMLLGYVITTLFEVLKIKVWSIQDVLLLVYYYSPIMIHNQFYPQQFIIQLYMEEEWPTLTCSVQTHMTQHFSILLVYCLFSDQINTWHVHKESVNKDWVRAAYFKPMHLWRCSQNQWKHYELALFCMSTLDLWCPWTMQQYTYASKFSWES